MWASLYMIYRDQRVLSSNDTTDIVQGCYSMYFERWHYFTILICLEVLLESSVAHNDNGKVVMSWPGVASRCLHL